MSESITHDLSELGTLNRLPVGGWAILVVVYKFVYLGGLHYAHLARAHYVDQVVVLFVTVWRGGDHCVGPLLFLRCPTYVAKLLPIIICNVCDEVLTKYSRCLCSQQPYTD